MNSDASKNKILYQNWHRNKFSICAFVHLAPTPKKWSLPYCCFCKSLAINGKTITHHKEPLSCYLHISLSLLFYQYQYQYNYIIIKSNHQVTPLNLPFDQDECSKLFIHNFSNQFLALLYGGWALPFEIIFFMRVLFQ